MRTTLNRRVTTISRKNLLPTLRYLKKLKAGNMLRPQTKRKLKRAYKASLLGIKHHPFRSFGLFAFALGVLSGIFFFVRSRR